MSRFFISVAIVIMIVWRVDAQNRDLIQSDTTFTPQGRVEMVDVAGQAHRRENGTVNGVAYRIYYSDGSGSFQGDAGNPTLAYVRSGGKENWSVGCEKDPIDDSVMCHMYIYDLWVFLTKGRDPWVSIGGSSAEPGSDVFIRLDGEKAISAKAKEGFRGASATHLLDRLKTAKQVTTRWTKFPSGTFQDRSFELFGFKEALQYLNWAVSKVK